MTEVTHGSYAELVQSVVAKLRTDADDGAGGKLTITNAPMDEGYGYSHAVMHGDERVYVGHLTDCAQLLLDADRESNRQADAGAARTRLPNVTDPTAHGARAPVVAEVRMHDPDGHEFVMRVTCGFPGDIVPAAERAIEAMELDLGVSDWKALS